MDQDLIGQYDIEFLPTLFMAALIFAAVVSLIAGVVDYAKAIMHSPGTSPSE